MLHQAADPVGVMRDSMGTDGPASSTLASADTLDDDGLIVAGFERT